MKTEKNTFRNTFCPDKRLCFLAGKSLPTLLRSWLRDTGYPICYDLPQFALFVLFAIRCSGLFDIRYQSGFPNTPTNLLLPRLRLPHRLSLILQCNYDCLIILKKKIKLKAEQETQWEIQRLPNEENWWFSILLRVSAKYSLHLEIFCFTQLFQGNTDMDTVVYHDLNPIIEARYIRVRPTKWYGHISMRMELYTC